MLNEQTRKSVLVVEDDPHVLELVTRCLSKSGYAVLRSQDISGGMDTMSRSRVNAVVTDFDLPDGTGAEFSDFVHSYFPHIPVLLLTGWRNAMTQDLKPHFDEILYKPFTMEELRDFVSHRVEIPPE